jgi:hypothetical protein
MWRKLSAAGAVIVAALLLVLAGVVVSIRSGLQRYSDNAMARFPGDRTEALIRLVDCATCSLEDRNHAVWALGQMVEVRAIHSLKRHFDGQPCTHATRLCQHELRKAIRMIESRPENPGALRRLASAWHRPWHY